MQSQFYTYFLTIALFAVLITASTENAKEKVVSTFRKCREINPISEEEVQQIKNKETVPSSKEAKCLAACMFREGGMLKDGKYNKEVAKAVAEALHKDDPTEIGKAKEMIEYCTKEVGQNAGNDECEFAYKMVVCSHNYANKVGLKQLYF